MVGAEFIPDLIWTYSYSNIKNHQKPICKLRSRLSAISWQCGWQAPRIQGFNRPKLISVHGILPKGNGLFLHLEAGRAIYVSADFLPKRLWIFECHARNRPNLHWKLVIITARKNGEEAFWQAYLSCFEVRNWKLNGIYCLLCLSVKLTDVFWSGSFFSIDWTEDTEWLPLPGNRWLTLKFL